MTSREKCAAPSCSRSETPATCRVYVDLDDVLCETMRGFLRILERDFKKRVKYQDVFSFNLKDSFALTSPESEAFFTECHAREVLLGLEPTESAPNVLRAWSRAGFWISIVTGRPTSTRKVTQEWLRRNHIPYSELMFVDKYCRDPKGLSLEKLPVEIFTLAIEDNLDVARGLLQRGGLLVALFDRPWNTSGTAARENNDRLIRCRRWSEIADLCSSACTKRKPVLASYVADLK